MYERTHAYTHEQDGNDLMHKQQTHESIVRCMREYTRMLTSFWVHFQKRSLHFGGNIKRSECVSEITQATTHTQFSMVLCIAFVQKSEEFLFHLACLVADKRTQKFGRRKENENGVKKLTVFLLFYVNELEHTCGASIYSYSTAYERKSPSHRQIYTVVIRTTT